MNDFSPPPPYENTFAPKTTSSSPVFSLTKSMVEVKELIESLKSSAHGQSFAIDDLKTQLATIQSAMERIESSNKRHLVTSSELTEQSSPDNQTLPLTSLASSSGQLPGAPGLPVETDEESYERICKILEGLISDASTAVKSDIDSQKLVSTGEDSPAKTAAHDVFEPLLERDKQSVPSFGTIDTNQSKKISSTSRRVMVLSLLSPISTILQLAYMVLSTSILPTRLNKPSQSDTLMESENLPLSERLFSYLRHQFRRTVYSVNPFVDVILLTPTSRCHSDSSLMAISAFPIPTSSEKEEDRSTPWSTSPTSGSPSEFGPRGIRGFLYAIWWSFVFAIAACLWDADLVKFASGRVEQIVTGNDDRRKRGKVSSVPTTTD